MTRLRVENRCYRHKEEPVSMFTLRTRCHEHKTGMLKCPTFRSQVSQKLKLLTNYVAPVLLVTIRKNFSVFM